MTFSLAWHASFTSNVQFCFKFSLNWTQFEVTSWNGQTTQASGQVLVLLPAGDWRLCLRLAWDHSLHSGFDFVCFDNRGTYQRHDYRRYVPKYGLRKRRKHGTRHDQHQTRFESVNQRQLHRKPFCLIIFTYKFLFTKTFFSFHDSLHRWDTWKFVLLRDCYHFNPWNKKCKKRVPISFEFKANLNYFSEKSKASSPRSDFLRPILDLCHHWAV